MKVSIIYHFIFLLSLSILVLFDLYIGIETSHALSHLLSPFWVIETGEYIMLAFLFTLIIGQQFLFMTKKNQTKK